MAKLGEGMDNLDFYVRYSRAEMAGGLTSLPGAHISLQTEAACLAREGRTTDSCSSWTSAVLGNGHDCILSARVYCIARIAVALDRMSRT